ncbi:MAG: hypothetical protein KJP03_00860 [Gammaproteobacteria bacterium]|nr:hypothetical protein [Gammaproteobacteria bacterium]
MSRWLSPACATAAIALSIAVIATSEGAGRSDSYEDPLGHLALGVSLLYLSVCVLIARIRRSGPTHILRLLLQISIIVIWALLLSDTMGAEDFSDANLAGSMSRLGAALLMISLAVSLTADMSLTAVGRGVSRSFATLAIIYVVIAGIGALYDVPEVLIRWMSAEPLHAISLGAVVLLSIAIITLHPDRGLPSLLIESTLPAQQLRFLLPAIFILPLAVGLISLELSGTFSTQLQISFTALSSAVVV